MRTLPIFVAVIAAAVTSVLTKEAAKDGKVELGLHAIVRRSPPGRSRELSWGGGYGYGCLTCGGGYHNGHSSGGLSYGTGSHSGGRSRGHRHHSGGRSRWGRGRRGGGRSYGGRSRGGRGGGGRSRGGRSRGGRSRVRRSGSFERYGYHHGGYEPSCTCPFLTSGSERWGSGVGIGVGVGVGVGVGGGGGVGVGGFDSVESNSSQNPGYYRQWYQAFSNHPCCAGSNGVITSYQRTRSRGYGVQ